MRLGFDVGLTEGLEVGLVDGADEGLMLGETVGCGNTQEEMNIHALDCMNIKLNIDIQERALTR